MILMCMSLRVNMDLMVILMRKQINFMEYTIIHFSIAEVIITLVLVYGFYIIDLYESVELFWCSKTKSIISKESFYLYFACFLNITSNLILLFTSKNIDIVKCMTINIVLLHNLWIIKKITRY